MDTHIDEPRTPFLHQQHQDPLRGRTDVNFKDVFTGGSFSLRSHRSGSFHWQYRDLCRVIVQLGAGWVHSHQRLSTLWRALCAQPSLGRGTWLSRGWRATVSASGFAVMTLRPKIQSWESFRSSPSSDFSPKIPQQGSYLGKEVNTCFLLCPWRCKELSIFECPWHTIDGTLGIIRYH